METAASWMLRKRRMRFTPRIMDTEQQEKLMNRFYSLLSYANPSFIKPIFQYRHEYDEEEVYEEDGDYYEEEEDVENAKE